MLSITNPSSATTASNNATSPSLSDSYEILSILSSSPSTIVYKAQEKKRETGKQAGNEAGQQVAIKESTSKETVKQAENEVRLEHENIIKIIHSCTIDDSMFIIYPYCPRGDLYHLLSSQSDPDILQLTPSLRCTIFSQIAHAVKYIHSKGIVHRDIKIDNILISTYIPTPHVLLSDFGLAHAANPSIITPKILRGSDEYIAPELFTHHHDPSTPLNFELVDCFAVGVVLYCLICGDMPFFGPTRKKMWHKIARGEWDRSGIVDKKAKECCEGLLKVKAGDRWRMADVLGCEWVKGV